MTAERDQHLLRLVEHALDKHGAERERYLTEACAGNLDLRREVDSLLAQDAASQGLDPPEPGALAGALAGLDAGARIGSWRIERPIGSGGMGTVFLAWREEAGFRQRGALKLVRSAFPGAEIVRRFARERRVLARLEHQHIARLLDGGSSADGAPYFVMEYVVGEPIDLWCAERKLGVRERIALFLQVAGAVEYAHRNLVVHRDLKPSNILVTSEGVPKLLDFGIAKVLESVSDDLEATQTQERRLTPAYASPEQLRGEDVTTATDVYSLGVVLYELLVGRRPFDSVAASELLASRAAPKPSSAARQSAETRRARELQGDLDTILLKALAEEPARRYASVEALSNDLRRWLEGRTVLARPDTALYRLHRFVRRNRILVGATAIVILSLLTGLIVSTRMYFRVRDARAAESIQTQAARRRLQSVVKLAATLTNDVGAELGGIPGAVEARARIVTKAVAALDGLAAEEELDRELAFEIGWGYLQLAQTLGAPYGPSVGKFDEALQVSARSDALLARAQAEHPEDARFPDVRCRILTNVVLIHTAFGRYSEALPAANQAVALAREARLLALESQRASALQIVAACLQRRAEVEVEMGDPRSALRDREECLEVSREAFQVGPDGHQRYQLASALDALAASQLESGDARAASDTWLEAIDQFVQVEQEFRGSLIPLSALNLARNKAAIAFLEAEDADEARNLCEQSLEFYEGLAKAEPDSMAVRQGLSMAVTNAATVASAMEDWPSADERWTRVREICQSARDKSVGYSEFSANLLDATAQLALVCARQERIDEALALVGEAESSRAALEPPDPNARRGRTKGARVDRALGECLLIASEDGARAEDEAPKLRTRAAVYLERCAEARTALAAERPLSPPEARVFASLDELLDRARGPSSAPAPK
jgi:non-specific serine/threonine protein kinase/serine/threonine-protein kinase